MCSLGRADTGVTLSLTSFSTNPGVDVLTIRDGVDNTAPILAQLSGWRSTSGALGVMPCDRRVQTCFFASFTCTSIPALICYGVNRRRCWYDDVDDLWVVHVHPLRVVGILHAGERLRRAVGYDDVPTVLLRLCDADAVTNANAVCVSLADQRPAVISGPFLVSVDVEYRVHEQYSRPCVVAAWCACSCAEQLVLVPLAVRAQLP